MRLLLIQPKMLKRPVDTDLKARMAPSLALLTLSALTPKSHEVLIVNENLSTIDLNMPVDAVGITVTVDVMPRAIQIAQAFRERGIPVIAGGIHVTSDPEGCQDDFDALCVGMAERVWPRILKDLERHDLKPRYRDMSEFNGNEIVAPDYQRLTGRGYLYTNILSASRGCPFRCDFCYNSCPNALEAFVNRPVAEMIAEIQALGTKHIMFIDDNFIGNPEWTKEFLKALTPLNIKWNAAVSANLLAMPGLMDDMQASGCQSLFIGFESIHPGAVAGVHKKQNIVDRYERLIEALHQRGIMVNASFVFGLDGEDASVFRRTLDWILKNKIETVTSHILTPYPGTRLYQSFQESGRITTGDLALYNTAHVVFKPKDMSPEALYEGYLWIYREVYSLKNILRRLPAQKRQWVPYLAFNLFYRKYGRFTAWVCRRVSFATIGKLFRRMAYKVN